MVELRITRAQRPLTDRWREVPVALRGPTLLGLSFRPLQAEALGLDPQATLRALLAYPIQLIRLGAYWDRIETAPDAQHFDALDAQIAAAEQAGKQIILAVGAVKTFGYPECFIPAHHLPQPLPEGARITPASHPALLAAAVAWVTTIVERYRDRPAIIAWQVEHDAVDPLGVEHSWRLSDDFVRAETQAARAADPGRPLILNGYLPTSLPVRAQQWRQTRDQGDSLAVAQRLADIVGVDYYPRHALARLGARSVYLDGSDGAASRARVRRLVAWSEEQQRPLMITEGQAEPWETATTPPNPQGWGMYSCLPEHVITNYNQCMQWRQWGRRGDFHPYAYLFWGAEYWLCRAQSGDERYLRAFARILAEA